MNSELLGRMERFLENELEKTKHGLKKIKRMIKTAIGNMEDEFSMRRRLVHKFFLKNMNRDALIEHEEEIKELENRAEEPDEELADPQLNIIKEPNSSPRNGSEIKGKQCSGYHAAGTCRCQIVRSAS